MRQTLSCSHACRGGEGMPVSEVPDSDLLIDCTHLQRGVIQQTTQHRQRGAVPQTDGQMLERWLPIDTEHKEGYYSYSQGLLNGQGQGLISCGYSTGMVAAALLDLATQLLN